MQVFLSEACQKRKNILDPVMSYCVQILNEPADKRDPRRKDGALNVIGTTSDVLMRVRGLIFILVLHVCVFYLILLLHVVLWKCTCVYMRILALTLLLVAATWLSS